MITAVNDIKTVYRFAWMCNVSEKSYWVKRRKNNQGRNGNSRKRIYIFSDPICAEVCACCSMFLESAEFIVFFPRADLIFDSLKYWWRFYIVEKAFSYAWLGFLVEMVISHSSWMALINFVSLWLWRFGLDSSGLDDANNWCL